MDCAEHLRARGGWRGEHRDVLLGPDGELVWEREWGQNVLVDTARINLAALVKGDPSAGRVAFWAVGTGDPAWDAGPPADAVRMTFTKLVAEVARKPIAPGQITFSPPGAAGKTLEIQSTFVAADFDQAKPLPLLREFGLFSSGTPSLLMNHRVHPPIGMQPGFTLQRTLRLTF